MCLAPAVISPVRERMNASTSKPTYEYKKNYRYTTSPPMLHKQQFCSKRKADKRGGVLNDIVRYCFVREEHN